ncbi:uncharacterized protein LOC134277751 [Saccostrea cucullata]|uniref:uncharacterized protein LOC134277751 n=1 Tax=Saccostrea cuccullata TaxID=36930 RepID=UPI002ED4822F
MENSKGFTYNTTENGSEGEHNATYIVSPADDGLTFTKIRHGHPVINARANYAKTLHFHDYLGTIHSVLIKEDFKSPRAHQSFDPHEKMRKVKSENNFSTIELPDMAYVSHGKLYFLTRHADQKEWERPSKYLFTASIQVGNLERKEKFPNITAIKEDIEGNLTCMENQPAEGSHSLAVCFHNIVILLKRLPDKEIVNLADFYFQDLHPKTSLRKHMIENMLDVYSALNTELTEKLLVEKFFLNPKPDPEFIQRIVAHIATNDKAPHELLLNTLEDAVFHQEKFPKEFYHRGTYSRCLLALGAISNLLVKEGQLQRAKEMIRKVHGMLGMHDPWEYRKKRSVMTEEEKESYDHHKVILLETLGNARMEESYDYIISHINSTNSQWIKRAGCHALRKYEHQHAADSLLYSALFDEDQSVRYEATLLYMSHPKGRMLIAPLNKFNQNHNESGYLDEDPYDSGIDVMDLSNNFRRERRSIWDGLKFRLEAPGVDWRKMIGSRSIGASFGVVMMNLMDLEVAPSNGHVQVKVHDEAYARINLGCVDTNIDFFVARVCFKGGAQYSINIFQVIFMGSNFCDLRKKYGFVGI